MSKFLEKEEAVLNALEKTDYAYFNGDKDKGLGILSEYFDAIPQLVTANVSQHIVSAAGGEKPKLLNPFEAAVNAVTELNKISEALDLEPFADIDTSKEDAVYEYALEVFHEMMSARD